MVMTEKTFQSKCIKWVKSQGCFYWKFQDKFSGGFPDLMIAKNGRVVFVELKRKGNKPTPLQNAVMEQMRKAGLSVYWTDDFEEFKSIVTKEVLG